MVRLHCHSGIPEFQFESIFPRLMSTDVSCCGEFTMWERLTSRKDDPMAAPSTPHREMLVVY